VKPDAQGILPYRDFVFVQPPGITLLMTPAALIAKATGSTAGGMAIGRILTTLASAAGVVLLGLLVRHRGVLATLVACGRRPLPADRPPPRQQESHRRHRPVHPRHHPAPAI